MPPRPKKAQRRGKPRRKARPGGWEVILPAPVWRPRIRPRRAPRATPAEACREKENRRWQPQHVLYRSRRRGGPLTVRRADRPVNVGDLERWLSLLGGGSWPSVRCGALGTVMLLGRAGALLYRGWTGHCALYQTMGRSTVSPDVPPTAPQRGRAGRATAGRGGGVPGPVACGHGSAWQARPRAAAVPV